MLPNNDDQTMQTSFHVDFSNVESRSFDPIPAGKYLVMVMDFEIRQTSDKAKNPNQPMIQHEFRIQEPTQVGDRKVHNVPLWTNFMPTIETTLFRLKGFLEALGDDVSGGLNYDPTEIMARPPERRLLVAKVKIQPERKDGDKTYDARNEIQGFAHVSSWNRGAAASGASGSQSLLP